MLKFIKEVILIPNDEIQAFIKKIPEIKAGKYSDYISKTRDIFDARLYSFTNRTQNWLFGAIIGEIGANTFDHNFTFPLDCPKGVFFDSESSSDFVYLCDFGAGLKKTLSRTIIDIQDDRTAIETAFTKPVSGRAPELRGNGLKFTISSIVENKWNLFYQSGNAVCLADKNGFSFRLSDFSFDGCFCILSCKEF